MSTAEPVQFSGSEANLNTDRPDEYQILVEFPQAQSGPSPNLPMPPLGRTRNLGHGSSSNRTDNGQAQQIERRSVSAINAAMSTIQEMALQTEMMRKGIPGGSQPRMIKVKFGINLDFEVGALIAKSGMGATMEIELEWARPSDDILRVLRAETDVEGALLTSAERLNADIADDKQSEVG